MAANGSLLPVVEVTVVFGKHATSRGPEEQLHKTEMYRRRACRVLADQVRGRAARVRGGLEKTREVKSEFVKSCGESTVVTYVPGTHRTITRHGVDGRRDGRFVTSRATTRKPVTVCFFPYDDNHCPPRPPLPPLPPPRPPPLPPVFGSTRLNIGAFFSISGMTRNRILLPRMTRAGVGTRPSRPRAA